MRNFSVIVRLCNFENFYEFKSITLLFHSVNIVLNIFYALTIGHISIELIVIINSNFVGLPYFSHSIID